MPSNIRKETREVHRLTLSDFRCMQRETERDIWKKHGAHVFYSIHILLRIKSDQLAPSYRKGKVQVTFDITPEDKTLDPPLVEVPDKVDDGKKPLPPPLMRKKSSRKHAMSAVSHGK